MIYRNVLLKATNGSVELFQDFELLLVLLWNFYCIKMLEYDFEGQQG